MVSKCIVTTVFEAWCVRQCDGATLCALFQLVTPVRLDTAAFFKLDCGETYRIDQLAL